MSPSSKRLANPPKAVELTDAWLPCVGSLLLRLPPREKLGSDRVAQLSCVDGPTDPLAGAELSRLVGCREARAPPPLGFSSLLHNLPFPWCVLRPALQILSELLESTHSAWRSVALLNLNLISSLPSKNIREGAKKIDIWLREVGGSLIRIQETESPRRAPHSLELSI